VYPAFFGGPLAATVLGLLNGRRLSLTRTHLMLIAVAGIAAIAARVVFVATTGGNSLGRLSGAVAGLLVWLVVNALQRRPFRAFLQNNGEPASLVWPGVLAAIGCGLAEAALIFGVIL